MRKLIAFGAMLACAAIMIGCGKKEQESPDRDGRSEDSNEEKIVRDFCTAAQKLSSALATCDYRVLEDLQLTDYPNPVMKTRRRDEKDDEAAMRLRRVRDAFSAIACSKDPVKTKVIGPLKDVKGAIVSASCGEATLYFVVRGKDGEKIAIQSVTADKQAVMEQMEKRERGGKNKGIWGIGSLTDDRIETTCVLIKNVETAAGTYKIKKGRYPATLDALREPETEGGDPWLEGDPVDPWGNELKYELQGKRKPKITSWGPDGVEGGDDDITNYDGKKVIPNEAGGSDAGRYLFSPSDEARVKETFTKMAAALDKSGTESSVDALAKARNAVALVEPGCTVKVFGQSQAQAFRLSNNAPDITGRVVAFRNMVANMHFAFKDISVKFTDKTTAEATCEFFYKGDDFGWSVRDARALDATLRKDPESGRWRFARVRLSNIIKK